MIQISRHASEQQGTLGRPHGIIRDHAVKEARTQIVECRERVPGRRDLDVAIPQNTRESFQIALGTTRQQDTRWNLIEKR